MKLKLISGLQLTLNEGGKISYLRDDLPYMVNPNAADLVTLGRQTRSGHIRSNTGYFRGIVDSAANLWIWPGDAGYHDGVARLIKLGEPSFSTSPAHYADINQANMADDHFIIFFSYCQDQNIQQRLRRNPNLLRIAMIPHNITFPRPLGKNSSWNANQYA